MINFRILKCDPNIKPQKNLFIIHEVALWEFMSVHLEVESWPMTANFTFVNYGGGIVCSSLCHVSTS